MKLTHIEAENFLGIRRADVSLHKPITLFAGGNFAGKSSLQEAVRMALTGEAVRVDLKKEYGALVTEGARNGFAQVSIDAGGTVETASIVLPSGKASQSAGFASFPALPYVLNAQRFATLDEKARRSFLFGLMGIRITPETVSARMLQDGMDKAKVDRVAPMLRAGFDAACTEAKTKATEAKGAWRALTGETYGSVKAASWKADKGAVKADAHTGAQQRVASIDQQIADANQNIGALQVGLKAHAARVARISTLTTAAEQVERVQTKLATDEASLQEWEQKVAETEAKASGAAPTQPLVCPHCQGHVELAGAGELRAYVAPDAVRDAEAEAALPAYVRSRDLLRRAVENDRRDLDAARAAAAELKSLTDGDQPAAPKQSDLDEATQGLAALKTKRVTAAAELEKFDAIVRAAKEADQKTASAAAHHADVVAWDAIAAALAPDGIPGKMLAEALSPINERLLQSSADSEWLHVGIDADMSINCLVPGALRPYALLSESERWRVDAMVAEAISHQSGLKLLVLDRFDVLDLQGRSDLLAWLDVLAQNGEIETALLFGTLKSLPSGLPQTVAAEWIHNGQVGQLKEAA
jgi:hypothetical protein